MAAGPWEKYANPTASPTGAEAAGPWQKYGGEAPPAASEASTGGRVGTGEVAAPEEPSVGLDVARGLGTGIRQGLEGMAGMAGDINEMNSGFISKGAEWLGASPETASTIGSAAKWLNPATAWSAMAPTTEEIQKEVTKPLMGAPYRPSTMAGQYARTIGEFAPSAMMGPGGAVRKTAMAAVPAIASETAGQITEGTSAEPYARMAGAMAGGLAAAGRAPSVVKEAAKGAPTREALKVETDQLYQTMRDAGIRYDANEFGDMVTKAATDLKKQGFRSSTADQAYKLIDDLANDIGNAPDFDDINGLVQQTGAAARAAAAKGDHVTAKALGVIRDHLDDFEAKSAMTVDDPNMTKDAFNELRTTARETAHRNIKARALDEILENADTYTSGWEAGVRNGIGNLLRSKKGRSLFNDQERSALLQVQQGRKTLKTFGDVFGFDAGNIMGRANAIPAITNAVAYGAGGPIAIGLGAAGTAAKYVSPMRTKKAFEQAAGSIRAPKAARAAAMDQVKAKSLQRYVRGVLAAEAGEGGGQ